MENIKDEPAYSKNVLELLRVANEYCLFVEKIEHYENRQMIDFMSKLFPLLYLKGAMLPPVQVDDPSANERYVTLEQYEIVFNSIRKNILGMDDFLYMDYTPPADSEPVRGSVSEMLTDIYQDLKDFMLLYQQNRRAAKQNAAHECRQLFYDHWGPRILYVLNVIHPLIIEKEKDNPSYLI